MLTSETSRPPRPLDAPLAGTRGERAAAYGGLVFLVVFGVGWLFLARLFPPFSPDLSPAETVAAISYRRDALLAGSVIMMVATLVYLPVWSLLVQVMRQIEGRTGILTLMLGFSCGTCLISNFFTGLFLSAAAFRPDRDPATTQLATDLAMLLFIGGIALFVGIWFLTAYAILVVDRGREPVLPRWFGYLNLLAGLLYIPDLLIYVFKTGPFAWDGLIGFWIPAGIFIAYFLALTVVLPPVVRRASAMA